MPIQFTPSPRRPQGKQPGEPGRQGMEQQQIGSGLEALKWDQAMTRGRDRAGTRRCEWAGADPRGGRPGKEAPAAEGRRDGAQGAAHSPLHRLLRAQADQLRAAHEAAADVGARVSRDDAGHSHDGGHQAHCPMCQPPQHHLHSLAVLRARTCAASCEGLRLLLLTLLSHAHMALLPCCLSNAHGGP